MKKQIDEARYLDYRKLNPKVFTKMQEKVAKDILYYPKCHIAPKYGLLNDPNGLTYFEGYYYISYQYHPNGPEHGLKHWYQLRTRDFINYESMGIIISPSEEFDKYGVYSGGAIRCNDEIKYFYSGNSYNQDFMRQSRQIMVKVDQDGKLIKKLLIDVNDEYTDHFRDPFAYRFEGQNYLMVGGQKKDLLAGIEIYQLGMDFEAVQNNYQLKFLADFKESFMFECPSIYIDNTTALIMLSPQGIVGERFKNMYSVAYIVEQNFDNKVIKNKTIELLDYGFDFYAPQIFTSCEEQLFIGWIGQGKYPYEEQYQWSQMLSCVRTFEIVNQEVHQSVHHSIEKLRGESFNLEAITKLSKRCIDFELKVAKNFEIRIGNETNYISFKNKNGKLILDRSKMDVLVNDKYGQVRDCSCDLKSYDLRILLDGSVLEIFVLNTKYCFSLRFFIKEIEVISIEQLITGCGYYLDAFKYEDKF